MTEKQFWHSNPRIIKVYEDIYKERQNRINELIHMFVGNYGLSALVTAIDNVLNGKKAVAKYIEKPIELFPLTEEEKEKKKQNAIAQFMGWAGVQKNNLKGKGGK